MLLRSSWASQPSSDSSAEEFGWASQKEPKEHFSRAFSQLRPIYIV